MRRILDYRVPGKINKILGKITGILGNSLPRIPVIFPKTIELLLQKESPVSTLNKNETQVYEIIKLNGNCKIGLILDQVDMSRAGLKTLLKRMLESGHIKSKGVGKGTLYYIS